MKPHLKPHLKGGIVAALILGGLFVWYRSNVSELPVNRRPPHYEVLAKMEAEGVPDFTLPRVADGRESLVLSSLKGKVILLNFWASWCNPCLEEFPSMIKLAEHFSGDVVIVAVATDEQLQDVEVFMKAFGLPRDHFEVVWDKDNTVRDTYGIQKVPESFLVGKDFRLIRKVLGIEDWFTEGAIAYFSSLVAGKESSTVH